MNLSSNKLRLIALLLTITAYCIGCSSSSREASEEPVQEIKLYDEDIPKNSPKETSSQVVFVDYIDVEGANVGTIVIGNRGRLSLNGEEFKVTQKAGSKKKYKNRAGNTIAKINYYDDAFKLKTEAGDALWKVKFKPDKIKVYQAEQAEPMYELKIKDQDRVKVLKGGSEIAEVRSVGNKEYVLSTGYSEIKVNGTGDARLVAAFRMDGIPKEHNLIIAQEMMEWFKSH